MLVKSIENKERGSILNITQVEQWKTILRQGFADSVAFRKSEVTPFGKQSYKLYMLKTGLE